MGDSPDFLPKGWVVETRPKQDGRSYKCYIAPSSGLKFQSMKKVYEYLKIEDPRKSSRSSKRGADVSSTSQRVRKTKDSPDFLPEGWIVETRLKQNCDSYKRYIAPSSGQVFNSRKKVFEFLNIEDPSKSSRSSKRGADVSSTSQATISWEDAGEEFPAGWISGVKARKSDKGKKDSHYIDPVTGYIFHSRKDVFRYLATGEIGRHASKPKNEVSHTVQLTDGEDSPSNRAKRQKVKGSTVTRCLFTGQSSNKMTVNSNQMQDPPAAKEEQTSDHASLQGAKTASLSILASQNSDDSKKGRLLRSGKPIVTSLPAPDFSADSNDSKIRLLCSGNTLVTDLPAPDLSPDSDDSKKGRLLRSGKTSVTASPATEISPDSDDSKKGRLLGSGQTLGTDLPAPEISPDAGDSKKGRLLRSGKTLDTALPAPEISTDSDDSKKGRLLRCGKILGTALPVPQNSPKKQLREIKGGVRKRENKKPHLKSSKLKEEFSSPLRASKRLSGVEVKPTLDLEIGRRKSLVAFIREANPLMGGSTTISSHQVLEPVDQFGSALEPKTTTRGRENGGVQIECEKASHKDEDTEKTNELEDQNFPALEPKLMTRGKESGEVRLECESKSHNHRDTELINGLVDRIGSASEPKSITRGKKSGEVQLKCENPNHIDGDTEKTDELVNKIGFALEPNTITKGGDSGEVQLKCEKAIHTEGTEKINQKPECSMNLPFGDFWSDPCLEFAFKTLTGEPKTLSRGKENGEIQLECEKEIHKDRNPEKTNGRQECSINLPFGDSWPDPCLEFAFKTLTGEPKIISQGKEIGVVQMESEKSIHKDRDTKMINDKPECSMNLPFGDSWPDPCLEFAFKTLTGEPKTISRGNGSGEVQLELEKAIHKDRNAEKTNGKPECSMDLPFGDSWPDPCLEFAFKTLTGETKTICRGYGGVEVQSDGEKAILKDSDMEKTSEKPECSINLPFGDSWPDPCLEFAFKTLTGDFPLDGDLTIQDYFHPVQTPNTSNNGVDGFRQIKNQFKFDPPEKPPSPPQLLKNPVFSAQGNATGSTFGAKNGLQQKHIAGSGHNSINR